MGLFSQFRAIRLARCGSAVGYVPWSNFTNSLIFLDYLASFRNPHFDGCNSRNELSVGSFRTGKRSFRCDEFSNALIFLDHLASFGNAHFDAAEVPR
jgi:hypothetical protein